MQTEPYTIKVKSEEAEYKIANEWVKRRLVWRSNKLDLIILFLSHVVLVLSVPNLSRTFVVYIGFSFSFFIILFFFLLFT